MNISLLNKFESKSDLTDWNKFVMSHPNGNFFQSPELFNIYSNTKNHEPICIIGRDNNGNILCVLLAVIIKNFKWGFQNYTARAIIQGGPLIVENNQHYFSEIFNHYESFINDRAVYTQYRNMISMSNHKQLLLDYDYIFEDHLNIIINLNKSKEVLWEEMNGKRRNTIKKAMKSNIRVKIKNDKNSIKESYRILKSLYKRLKVPLIDKSFFLELFKHNNEHYKAINFCAIYSNEIIGCMIVIAYNGRLYDLYAGSQIEYYNKNPNDLIPWEVFLWGKKNNYQIFDFGGAGNPNEKYGVRDYKIKFGGNIVNFGRSQKVHKPITYNIAKFILRLWKKYL